MTLKHKYYVNILLVSVLGYMGQPSTKTHFAFYANIYLFH